MRGAIPPLRNIPPWRGAQLKTQGQIYIYLTICSRFILLIYLVYIVYMSVSIVTMLRAG